MPPRLNSCKESLADCTTGGSWCATTALLLYPGLPSNVPQVRGQAPDFANWWQGKEKQAVCEYPSRTHRSSPQSLWGSGDQPGCTRELLCVLFVSGNGARTAGEGRCRL